MPASTGRLHPLRGLPLVRRPSGPSATAAEPAETVDPARAAHPSDSASPEADPFPVVRAEPVARRASRSRVGPTPPMRAPRAPTAESALQAIPARGRVPVRAFRTPVRTPSRRVHSGERPATLEPEHAKWALVDRTVPACPVSARPAGRAPNRAHPNRRHHRQALRPLALQPSATGVLDPDPAIAAPAQTPATGALAPRTAIAVRRPVPAIAAPVRTRATCQDPVGLARHSGLAVRACPDGRVLPERWGRPPASPSQRPAEALGPRSGSPVGQEPPLRTPWGHRLGVAPPGARDSRRRPDR
jgi:hypothetical protein